MATAAAHAPVRDFTVKPLFAEPYFIMNIKDAISPKQVEFVQRLKMNANQVNHISEELRLFDRPEMKSIKKAVDEALDVFAREVMGISNQLAVTQSWSLMNPPGVGMHAHTHSNSLVSGSLLYAPLPDPPGNIIFERDNGYRQIEMKVHQAKQNVYNTPRNTVVPKEGDLVLFSSAIQHYVEVNNSAETRHSIAFNTFPRGKIGSFREVSELEL